MTANVRLTSLKQSKLFYALSRYPDSQFAKYFSLKNIIVYKDVQNSEPGRFDYFSNEYDFIGSSKKTYSLLKAEPQYNVSENNHFARFTERSGESSDYFLYSPSLITDIDPSTLILPTKKVFSVKKPLFLDQGSYHRPKETLLNNYKSSIQGNENVHVDTKVFVKNRGKMLVKISNINPNSHFLLQLNQTFHPQWRIAVISRDEFEEMPCTDKKGYSNTQNSVCQADAPTVDLSAVSLLSKQRLSGRHFEGNVIGNDWLMVKQEYSKYLDKDGNLYVAIYYKRQVYYQVVMVFSLLLLGGGAILALLQEISMRTKKRRWNNDFVNHATEYLQSSLNGSKSGKKKIKKESPFTILPVEKRDE